MENKQYHGGDQSEDTKRVQSREGWGEERVQKEVTLKNQRGKTKNGEDQMNLREMEGVKVMEKMMAGVEDHMLNKRGQLGGGA